MIDRPCLSGKVESNGGRLALLVGKSSYMDLKGVTAGTRGIKGVTAGTRDMKGEN